MTDRRKRTERSTRGQGRGRHETPVSRRTRPTETTERAARTKRGAQSGEERARRRPSRGFVIVLSLLIIGTTVVLGGRWIVRQSYFRVHTVHIVGATHETRAAILHVSGLDRHPELYGLQTHALERSLATFPWVTDAQVTASWPHTVTVRVHETHAVGVASYRRSWVYVGANGANLGTAPATADLPTLVDPAAGAAWPYGRQGAAAVAIAAALPPAFAAQVRTVNVDPTGAVSLGMTTPVLFVVGDASNLTAKFTAIASVLKSTTLTPGDVVNVTVPDELTVTTPSSG